MQCTCDAYSSRSDKRGMMLGLYDEGVRTRVVWVVGVAAISEISWTGIPGIAVGHHHMLLRHGVVHKMPRGNARRLMRPDFRRRWRMRDDRGHRYGAPRRRVANPGRPRRSVHSVVMHKRRGALSVVVHVRRGHVACCRVRTATSPNRQWSAHHPLAQSATSFAHKKNGVSDRRVARRGDRLPPCGSSATRFPSSSYRKLDRCGTPSS